MKTNMDHERSGEDMERVFNVLVETKLFLNTVSFTKTPWTFSVEVDGVEWYPLSVSRKFAYHTKSEADSSQKKFKKTFSPDGWVVMKNADFTEGRGPMLPDKAFKRLDNAVNYIMSNSGIYGSQQGRTVSFGISVKGNPYCNDSYNGYNIELMFFED